MKTVDGVDGCLPIPEGHPEERVPAERIIAPVLVVVILRKPRKRVLPAEEHAEDIVCSTSRHTWSAPEAHSPRPRRTEDECSSISSLTKIHSSRESPRESSSSSRTTSSISRPRRKRSLPVLVVQLPFLGVLQDFESPRDYQNKYIDIELIAGNNPTQNSFKLILIVCRTTRFYCEG